MYFFGSGFFHSTELAWDSGMLLYGAIVHCFRFLGTYSIMWTDWTPFTCWSTYVFSYNVIIYGRITYIRGFSDGSVGKEPACNAGDARDTGSIPGLGRSPGGGTATHSSILAWRIPWTEEPNRLWSTGRKESDTTEVTQHSTAQNTYSKVYTSYLTRWVNFHSEHACAAHTQMEKQERSSGLEDPCPPSRGSQPVPDTQISWSSRSFMCMDPQDVLFCVSGFLSRHCDQSLRPCLVWAVCSFCCWVALQCVNTPQCLSHLLWSTRGCFQQSAIMNDTSASSFAYMNPFPPSFPSCPLPPLFPCLLFSLFLSAS